MARGLNKVMLIGNLGNDPDVKYTQSDTCITTISIATSEQWKDKQTGQAQERTEWHRVKFFGKLAEIAGEYLTKGSQVYIEGKIRTEKYTDKQGIERYATDIIADQMQMLGSRGESRGDDGRDSGRGRSQSRDSGSARRGSSNEAPARRSSSQSSERQQRQPQGDFDDVPFDDDIPF